MFTHCIDLQCVISRTKSAQNSYEFSKVPKKIVHGFFVQKVRVLCKIVQAYFIVLQ